MRSPGWRWGANADSTKPSSLNRAMGRHATPEGAMKVNGIEILRDETVGRGGFLAVRRLHLVNVRDDGTRPSAYICDYIVRPKGVDAIVVAVYRRAARRPQGPPPHPHPP